MTYRISTRTQLSLAPTMNDLKLSSLSAIAGVFGGGSSRLARTTTTTMT